MKLFNVKFWIMYDGEQSVMVLAADIDQAIAKVKKNYKEASIQSVSIYYLPVII